MYCKYGKSNCIKWTCNSLVCCRSFSPEWLHLITIMVRYALLIAHTVQTFALHSCIPCPGTYVDISRYNCMFSISQIVSPRLDGKTCRVERSSFFSRVACNLYRYLFNHSTPWNINYFALGSTPAYFSLTLFCSCRYFFRVTGFICIGWNWVCVSKYHAAFHSFISFIWFVK